MQIAKSFGAKVTGVCSTEHLGMVLSNGADHVIDYTQHDFTQSKGHYDLIFEFVAKCCFPECKGALNTNGLYVTTEFSPGLALRGLWNSFTSSKKFIPLSPKKPNKSNQVFMRKLLEDGKVEPVIDRYYKLYEVPDALQYLSKGHAQGKVVIKV